MDVWDKDIPNKEKLPIKQRYIYSCGKTDGELENKSEIILNRKTYRNAPLLNFTIKLLIKHGKTSCTYSAVLLALDFKQKSI